MFVEISVEKGQSFFVTDSSRDASALCTEAGAGTFGVQPLGKSLTTEAQRRGGKNRAELRHCLTRLPLFGKRFFVPHNEDQARQTAR
jgi:hypothetical protein